MEKELGAEQKGRKEDPARCLVEVFRLMCTNPKDSREDLTTQNSSAYFGGECEGRKPGEGASVIVQCLEEQLEKLAAQGSQVAAKKSLNSQAEAIIALDAQDASGVMFDSELCHA